MYITPSQTNLLSEWKLDGNSTDVMNAHNGTDTNISYAAGKIGQCAVFNGTSSKIVTANTTGITGTSNATFLCLIKTTAVAGTIFGFGAYVPSVSQWRGLAIITGGYLRFDIVNTNVPDNTTPINDGKWHVVGFGNNGTTHYIFVDGKAVKSGVLAATNTGAGAAVFGATSIGDGFLAGSADQGALWNRLLTDAEILAYSKDLLSNAEFFNLF